MSKAWNSLAMTAGLASALTLTAIGANADDIAKQDFVNYCASCHGADGSGNGPMAAELKGKPTNLTTLSKNNDGHFPYLELRSVIEGSSNASNIRAHGSREMPVWGNVFRAETGMVQGRQGGSYALAKARIQNIVDYLADIQQ